MKPSQHSPAEYLHPSPVDANAMESVREMYQQINPVEQIDPLFCFIQNQLRKLNTASEAESSSSEGWLETVRDGTKVAAKTIDTIFEKLSNMDAVKEMESVILKVVKGVRESYWVFIGLSVAAYAVENYLSIRSKEKESRELLLNILELAKDLKQYGEQISEMSEEIEKLCNAVCTTVKGSVIFCDYLKRGNFYRCFENTNHLLRDVRDSLWEAMDVFLSHSGKQKKFVRQLHRDLKGVNVSCFFDKDDTSLPFGQKFGPRIFKAAETCKVAVVVLSVEFTRSKWPLLELSAFISARKKNPKFKILPIFFKITPKKLSLITKDSLEWKNLEESDDKRDEWQHAIKVVRSIKGLEFGENENEVLFRDKVVEKIHCLLQREAPEVASSKVMGMQSQHAKRFVPCPSELLDFKPEGIEDQVEEVKKMLDIEGSEQAKAVVIVGLGGLGKSTLAASVVQSLNLSSTDFKFSMVTIDQKTCDMRSHIVQLQQDIIFHFTGEEDLHLHDPQQGRQKLQAAMASKSCFLYIDNVVDSCYIRELLPRKLLAQNPSSELKVEKVSGKNSEMSTENSQKQMQNTKIRILVTSRQNNLKPLLTIKNYVHEFKKLHEKTMEELLRRIILQDEQPYDFEEKMINELAKACRSVPLLMSVFGNYLKDKRNKVSYKEALKALEDGNLDPYSDEGDELLSENLMYVYDKMKDKEAKEAFLDICTYFNGWPWNVVNDIVDRVALETLHNKKLVNKSEQSTVIIHDILRVMGAKKAKDTRFMNYSEFLNINDDESKLKNVKGLVLVDHTFLATLETKHLNVMRHSLRFLVLGDWVRLDGPPCDRAFENLRYLQVGDLKDFPFKDVSKMEKCNVFRDSSKTVMELAQLPRSLKILGYQMPYRDCNEFPKITLKNLKYLKEFVVQTKRSVRLPQGFKLPASLEYVKLIRCEQLPETFGHLSALQTLILDKCSLKCLPQGFTQCVEIRVLSLQNCTNLISLSDASLRSLTNLHLKGCTHLENLPADLGSWTALQNLDIRECKSLRVLPENFGGLKSLKTLALEGCISLQRLPDSFGRLRIQHLTLKSLASLKELPQSIGDLSCLKSLRLISCHSLKSVPNSFVQLTNLDALDVEDCIKVVALPRNFEQLRSLKKINFSYCPLLRTLPDGFQALKTLKLEDCSSLENLPACFEMLSCLEELSLEGLLFSSLPDALGKLRKLKILRIGGCCNFQTWPQDFENLATLEQLYLWSCHMLEGTTMDKIVKLQICWYVNIHGSTKLKERWNEMEEEQRNLPIFVRTSRDLAVYGKELDRARSVGLLCGKCIEVDSTSKELIRHSSVSVPNNTTIAVISLKLDQHQLLQLTVDMAKERATSNCAGQLRIIYVCRRRDDSDAANEDDESKKIRQTLMMLPQGISYAIPSTDIRRLSLIGYTIFDNANVFNDDTGPKIVCFMVDVGEDCEGHQILKDGKCVTEDEISKNYVENLPIFENTDYEIEISDGIVEFINCICESETGSPSEQCSLLPEENMVGEFIKKLKIKNIDYFSDSEVKVDHLQGKTVAIILIDQDYPECIRLHQIYHDIKLKQSNFEAIWIPLREKEDYGFGTYSRAIQRMPWLTLADPKLIKIDDIKDKSPRVIIINSGGRIWNPNALSLLMSWGADACPFTEASLSQLDLKSSWKILFHSMKIKKLDNKLIFLYSEPPGQKFKMKCALEKLLQIHGKGNFEIVYVGRFVPGRSVAGSLQETYEDATQSMNWTKLSFGDMMTFWYRCKYLSEEQNLAPPLNRLLEALLVERRWLVVVDRHGTVTANGMDLVEMACESSDDAVEMTVEEELRGSLKKGKCSEGVKTFFRDEINHPQHHHPLRPRWRTCRLSCDRCGLSVDHTSYGKRIYNCYGCDWDLCSECWKEWVKEDVRRRMQQLKDERVLVAAVYAMLAFLIFIRNYNFYQYVCFFLWCIFCVWQLGG